MVLNEQENTLRKYLLGELSEPEQETVELWLMSGDEAYDLLAAAEDDLIDELIGGKLGPHELERFNNHFLLAPERKRKLQFGQALRRYVDEERSVAVGPAPTPTFTFWDFFHYRPALAYAASALLVLLLGGGVWAGYQFLDIQRQQIAVAEEREALRKQLDESQARGEQLQTVVSALDEAVKNVKASPTSRVLVAVALMPVVTRSATVGPNIDLNSNAQLAELSLTLLDDDYASYRAVLVSEGGKELYTEDRLRATTAGENKAVVLTIPTSILSPGNFTIRLSGRSDANPPEEIDSYPFSATK